MLIIITVLLILSRFPLKALYPLSSFFAFLMRLCSYRKKVTEDNLRNAFPEKSDAEIHVIRNQYYRNLSDVLMESAKSFHITADEIKERVRFTNPELATNLVKEGKAFITLSSHQCNWEWQLLASSLLGFPIDAAYKQLRNQTVDDAMRKMRSQFGAELLESKGFLRACVRRKDIVRGIAMVGDQRPGAASHCEVMFLHQNTRFFTGAEQLAKLMHYPMLFMEMHRTGKGHYEITLTELASPPYKEGFDITKRYAQLLEESIKKQPANWLWSHKRWKVI